MGNTRVSFRKENNKLVKTAVTNFDPWGMVLKGIGSSNTPDNRWELQGHEKDNTFGLNRIQFGARTLNPTIGVFDRVDRFSEKYSSLSPMSYSAGNPVRFIDVNGDSLWIIFNHQNFLFDNGKLYHKGQEYKGKIKGFLADAYAAINKINEGGDAGSSLISSLVSSKKNITISTTEGEEGNSTTGLKVKWGSEIFEGGLDEKGSTTRPSYIGLGHELAHAQDYAN